MELPVQRTRQTANHNCANNCVTGRSGDLRGKVKLTLLEEKNLTLTKWGRQRGLPGQQGSARPGSHGAHKHLSIGRAGFLQTGILSATLAATVGLRGSVSSSRKFPCHSMERWRWPGPGVARDQRQNRGWMCTAYGFQHTDSDASHSSSHPALLPTK